MNADIARSSICNELEQPSTTGNINYINWWKLRQAFDLNHIQAVSGCFRSRSRPTLTTITEDIKRVSEMAAPGKSSASILSQKQHRAFCQSWVEIDFDFSRLIAYSRPISFDIIVVLNLLARLMR